MGALDNRLYTLHHTPTDTVARVGQVCVKLVLNGCSYLQSTSRLSLQRQYIQSTPMYRSYRSTQHPHPPTGRTGMTSVSENPDEPLLHV
jgi:hypothetical protein